MNNMQRKVREFHEDMGQPAHDTPGLISEERADLRFALTQEELYELSDAMDAGDLVGIADALGDILYVVFGTAVEYGIDLQPIFDEIHRSNMSKLDANGEPVPHPTIPGKIGKSDLYSPPNLEPILEAQGWRA